MDKTKLIKLIALKLFRLASRDRQWVIARLPEEYKASISDEIQVLQSLGLESETSLIESLESELIKENTKDEFTDLVGRFEALSEADKTLLTMSVDQETRKILNANRVNGEQTKTSSKLGQKFAQEYVKSLRERVA